MFKCSTYVIFTLLFISACAHNSSTSKEIIDVEKACGEEKNLVFKLMKFQENDFAFQKKLGRQFGTYEILDLKPQPLKKEGLNWMQVRFEKGRLQSLWFGPREDLKTDLVKIGLKPSVLRTKKGQELATLQGGDYYVKDVEGRRFRVEHLGRPQKGTTVTCFPIKKGF